MRNAKIVCTLGPASNSRGTVAELVEAGMTVARVNASHGEAADRRRLLTVARAVDDGTGAPLAVMLDTQGPEVRTAAIDAPVQLATGSTVRFSPGDAVSSERIGLTESITAVEPGDAVLLDDGRIETVVESVSDDTVVARVQSGGELGSRSGVNTPGVDLGLPVLTDKDRRDLTMAVEESVDFVAASFVRDADDVIAVNEALEAAGAEIPVVAKIERADAVESLEEIIEAAYGVMIARGDLGVECPMEDVPMIQKRIIRRCHAAGVPVITATEMLDSMVHERRPTRAEASDVANAVLDGTDAVMLSAETAIGDHPVRVVDTMGRIIREVERSAEYRELREGRVPESGGARTDAIARSARYLARDLGASAIVVVSESGYTALKTAKYRPSVPIVATTPRDRVRRQLALSWGVNVQSTDQFGESASDIVDQAVEAALEANVAESGDTVVVVSGMMTELEGTDTANMLKAHVAAETVATGRGVVRGRTTGRVARLAQGDLEGVGAGTVAVLEPGFDTEFVGNLDQLVGIVDSRPGMTGYPAMIARELGLPMISGADIGRLEEGDRVTVDGERGVVYAGEIHDRSGRDDRPPVHSH